MLLVLALACTGARNTGPGPQNPGVGDVDSTTWGGTAHSPAPGDLVFVEAETGSRFNLAGQAFEGSMADDQVQLGVLPGMTAFWFAWSTHHPGARVWQNGTNNSGAQILGSEQCGVPCDEITSACGGGMDCIPSIDDPDWVPSGEPAPGYLDDADRVLGIARDGLARAYPLDALWRHEIVNDRWGDWAFTVSYCPLTGSGILFDGQLDGEPVEFGVSGNLFNSNLVLYDRNTESLFGQMRQVGVTGDHLGTGLASGGLIDTTWGAWRTMYPQTEVLGARHSGSYPYGDYRTDHDNIFRENSPAPDPMFPNKSYAIGVIGTDETVIYPFEALETQGEVTMVEDMLGDLPVLVTFDTRTQTAAIFSRRIDGVEAHFTLE